MKDNQISKLNDKNNIKPYIKSHSKYKRWIFTVYFSIVTLAVLYILFLPKPTGSSKSVAAITISVILLNATILLSGFSYAASSIKKVTFVFDENFFRVKGLLLTTREMIIPWQDVRSLQLNTSVWRFGSFCIEKPMALSIYGEKKPFVPIKADIYLSEIHDYQIIKYIFDQLLKRVTKSVIDPRIIILRDSLERAHSLTLQGNEKQETISKEVIDLNFSAALKKLKKLCWGRKLSVDEMILQSELMYFLKLYEKAVQLSKEVLEIHPENFWARLCQALSLWDGRKDNEGLLILKNLAEKKSENQQVLISFIQNKNSSI